MHHEHAKKKKRCAANYGLKTRGSWSSNRQEGVVTSMSVSPITPTAGCFWGGGFRFRLRVTPSAVFMLTWAYRLLDAENIEHIPKCSVFSSWGKISLRTWKNSSTGEAVSCFFNITSTCCFNTSWYRDINTGLVLTHTHIVSIQQIWKHAVTLRMHGTRVHDAQKIETMHTHVRAHTH